MRRKHGLSDTLLISDLIAELEYLLESHGDLPVLTSSDYGDYCHTEQVNTIQSVDVTRPVESGYSHSGYAIGTDGEDEATMEEGETPAGDLFVVLRYT